MKPDLTDPVQLAAYRAELRGVARPIRLMGVALACVGAGVMLARTYRLIAAPAWLPVAIIGVAFMLMITSISARTRYHARRMRD